jgi:hypothetical protein
MQMRFGAKSHLTEKEAAYYLNIDLVNDVAFVALAEENGKPTMIDGARYVVPRPGPADVALAGKMRTRGHRSAGWAPRADRLGGSNCQVSAKKSYLAAASTLLLSYTLNGPISMRRPR